MTTALRFFLLVSPVPGFLTVALVVATALGGWVLWLNPKDADSALGSVLLLQMFASSTSYARVARRGHYDWLLVSGTPRTQIALADLAAGAAPGALAWLAVAAIQAAADPGRWPDALTAHRLMAFSAVSVTAWLVGVQLPRGAAGALWSAVLVALLVSRYGVVTIAAAGHTAPADATAVLRAAAVCLICPFIWLGDGAGGRDPHVLGVAAAALVAALVLGTQLIARREYPVVEAT